MGKLRTFFIFLIWAAGIGLFLVYLVRVWPYFSLEIAERPFHPEHFSLKPGGSTGHLMGTAGTLLILVGVGSYSLRKRWKRLWSWGSIRYWMNFHIFCCISGPALIFFHTALKIGGIVSISFWSMVAVVLSGIIGRYFYTQIPRSVSGLELSVQDIDLQLSGMKYDLMKKYQIPEEWINDFRFPDPPEKSSPFRLASQLISDRLIWQKFKKTCLARLEEKQIEAADKAIILGILYQRAHLIRKKASMHLFQSWLHFWHVFHLPFAGIMAVILLLHVALSVYSGYGFGF